jgi:hypothetical protein
LYPIPSSPSPPSAEASTIKFLPGIPASSKPDVERRVQQLQKLVNDKEWEQRRKNISCALELYKISYLPKQIGIHTFIQNGEVIDELPKDAKVMKDSAV